MSYLLAWICALALASAGFVGLEADDNDHLVTLSGCVIPGGGDGYLLTNIPMDAIKADTIEPGPVGTSGARPSIFYWLVGSDGISNEIGHKVEVRGELIGDAASGEMTIDRQADRTNIEIKSEGRTLQARVPESLFTVSPAGTMVVSPTGGTEIQVLVRRVDAKHVRLLAASCD